MITQHGPICDVCGSYILLEPGHFFALRQAPGQHLCCHERCKKVIEACAGDWEKLPPGPLRTACEEATAKKEEA